ncbi:membrane protein [Cellvibrio zantedeschiae]|uniref:Membrane protein n=1 Tax=Cellvibrio zantedeschiae TaxID=1237077 RepID=A0ABQ3B7L0_9GAMM|nr:TerC family protein [Cellvibrio zantedeschiae]GGY78850.1 membrane protein [Cellvibrio zantedeschiae]
MFEWIASPEAWVALATLTALEIVLGIDNIIFLSILVGRLPEHQRKLGRTLGLGFAMLTRLALLFSLTWVMSLTHPFMSPFGYDISGRDLILIGGGLFLLYKATVEIHQSVEGEDEAAELKTGSSKFFVVILQIAILDIVFSLDSVITAVGLVSQITLMAIAIVIAVGVMMFAAKSIGEFVENHPTVKILALSFLVVVGVTLVMEGFEVHVPKGYIYFAMAFSLGVEMINIRMRKKLTAKTDSLQ